MRSPITFFMSQILFGDLGEPLVEDHDAVPLRALLALAAHPVAPRGGDRQIGNAHTVLGRAQLGATPPRPISFQHPCEASRPIRPSRPGWFGIADYLHINLLLVRCDFGDPG
jgi:hypothetical protein